MFAAGIVLRQMISSKKRLFGPIISITILRRVHLSFGIVIWFYSRGLVFTGAYLDSRVYGNLRIIIALIETVSFICFAYVKEANYQISMNFYTPKISGFPV